ncbi:hypothetical protein [Streptomyces boluensis]|uniref:Uncharacterized protein n=1 Tax=Streptomyces boluensis TaxID=1775135 RepID=A0A964UMV1_9ACTN|nr:hypothetical protein [Streptomyces boluensis]NBE51361.1 hypothetical protein [Streptomyces boluensis]
MTLSEPGKVGRAGSPAKPGRWRDRVREHQRIARAHGYGLVDVWLSPPLDDPDDAETLLKDELQRVHHAFDGEYFHDFDFELAVKIAGELGPV